MSDELDRARRRHMHDNLAPWPVRPAYRPDPEAPTDAPLAFYVGAIAFGLLCAGIVLMLTHGPVLR